MRIPILLIFCFVITSCARSTYLNHDEGAEEFVLASYRIQQGKFSILRMQGCESATLSPSYLQEYEIQTDENLVMIMGDVKNPRIAIDGRTRLLEVLAKAIMNPEANLFKSYVLRDGRALPVDFYKLIHLGDRDQNIVMHPGDKLFIAPAFAAHVVVCKEDVATMIPVSRGYISVREALATAGISCMKGKGKVQVVRNSIVDPKTYMLSWDHIFLLPDTSLLLMAGDTLTIQR